MHQVPLAVPLLLALLVPAVCCLHLSGSSKARHRQTIHLPRHAIALDEDPQSQEIDSNRLREALQQLLELNDGELQALMAGMPPHKVAPKIEPSTAFLLASSRQYLERLSTILGTVEETSPVKKSTWNPRIARRHKKENKKLSEEDPDSILSALTELSLYLEGTENDEARNSREGELFEDEAEEGVEEATEFTNKQERRRRSHHQSHGRKHQMLQAHGSREYAAHHYLYYLRTGECPMSGDGNPKRFCPSPTGSGEWHCIEDVELCDGISQCPNQEDESPTHCLFYNAMKTHLDEITKFIVFKNLS